VQTTHLVLLLRLEAKAVGAGQIGLDIHGGEEILQAAITDTFTSKEHGQ